MPWYLYLALKQLFPTGKPLSVFFLLSVTGVTLGVFLVLVVQSVMGGFASIYREKIIATNGQIRVTANGTPFAGATELATRLRERPEVTGASAYTEGLVFIQTATGRYAVPFARGVDPETETEVIPLGGFMLIGSVDELDDGSVILSSQLARNLKVGRGDTITLLTPHFIERLTQDEVYLPTELRVVGFYQTGWNDFDSNTLVITRRLFGEVSGQEGLAHGIALRLADRVDEFAVAGALNGGELPLGMRALTWRDQFADFLWVLALEKNMMFFLMLCVVVVAAFTIANAQLLAVLRKTREIGLLGAMGGRGRDLAYCFCFQGLIIGTVGTGTGIALALVVLHYRNAIIHAFARLTGSEQVLVQFYQFAQFPVDYALGDFIRVSLAAIILSLLAGLVPAWRAARLKPADALRADT